MDRSDDDFVLPYASPPKRVRSAQWLPTDLWGLPVLLLAALPLLLFVLMGLGMMLALAMEIFSLAPR